MATMLIRWKNSEGKEVANFHRKSFTIYSDKNATDEDIDNFKHYLENKGYEVKFVFRA